ncbi:hypothetical protein [Bacteroides faecalis]|uniref:Lipoprotein n=1 Tax=Bacteroides faecalis TaxID=2447885 RepID=A0A401LWS5_9BACE|nr:hypothetical protein [Bacteroides faecalis]GCB35969.1 hypothetical protein KGMB02408_29140 [Bacteroides faecalis]
MKKWTFLVASAMLVGATPVFTGCIDNDEPEGINILRKAKAELIMAKKVVEEAESLRVKAEATKLEAEAKVQEAEAELRKAQAEKVKAEAAQLAALTEAEKAVYAAQIAQIEAEIAQTKAKTEAAIAEAEAARQAAEDAHQRALVEIEKAKNTLSADELAMLSMYQTRYDAAANEYNTRYVAYTNAQSEYVKALAAAEKGQDNIQYTRTLEKNVITQQENVEAKKLALEEAEAKLEEVKAYVPGALAAKLTEAQDKWNDIQDELNALNVKIAEERIKNDAEYKKQADLQKAYNDLTTTEDAKIYAKPLTIELPTIGIPGYQEGKYEIIKEKVYGFHVDKDGEAITSYNGQNGYTTAVGNVQNFILELTNKQLDKDDQAWTQASINEMTAELKGLQETYDADLKTWQMAVDGYNSGNGTVYSKYVGYNPLINRINNYNASVEKLEPLRVDWVDKTEIKDDAEQAWINKTGSYEHSAWFIYNEANNKAWKEYESVANNKFNGATEDGTAWAAYRATEQTLNNAVSKAMQDIKVAQSKISLLEEKLAQNLTDEALKTQLDAAKKELGADDTEGLRKVYAEASNNRNVGLAKAAKTRDNAIAIADKERDLAQAQARKDYTNHNIDWAATNNLDPAFVAELKKNYEEAEAAWIKADELYQSAKEATIALYNEMDDAYTSLKKNVLDHLSGTSFFSSIYPPIITNELGINWNALWLIESNQSALTFDIKNLEINSKNFVIVASRVLYGLPSMIDNSNDQQYNDIINGLLNAERITPLEKAELDKIIITEHYLTDREYEAPTWYKDYGSFGTKLAKERDIAYAKAFINEQPTINAVLATLNEYLTDLEAQKDAQGEVVLEAYNNCDAQNEVIKELEATFEPERRELSMKSRLQGDLIASIQTAMDAAGTSDEAKRDEAAIKALITTWTTNVKDAKDAEFNAGTLLKDAEKALKDWNSALIDVADVKKVLMDNAKYYLDIAKTTADNTAAELQMILERLGVSTEK